MTEDPVDYSRFGAANPNETWEEKVAREGLIVPKSTEIPPRHLASILEQPSFFHDDEVFRRYLEFAVELEKEEGKARFYDEVIEEAKKRGKFIPTASEDEITDASFYAHWLSYGERNFMNERDAIIRDMNHISEDSLQFMIDGIRIGVSGHRMIIARLYL